MQLEDLLLSRLPRRDGHIALGRVVLINKLAKGGMGVVYAGWHQGLDIPVAVKFLSATYTEGNLKVFERFKREAQIAASLDEPNLVRVFDFDVINECPYLVMEWIPGRGLDEVVRIVGPLKEQEVITILRDVGQALYGLHERGIIHRDIKPSNIMLRAADGRIKLTDLGIAHEEKEERITSVEATLGTPAFMSPEQVKSSSAVTFASDIYSLGATAHCLLRAEVPFKGNTAFEVMSNVLNEEIPPLSGSNIEVSSDMQRLIAEMTQKDPESRISNVKTMLERLPMMSYPFSDAVLQAAAPNVELTKPEVAAETPLPTPMGTQDTIQVLEYSEQHLDLGLASSALELIPSNSEEQSQPSMLFLECLQNDFVSPIQSNQEPPNALHVGWAEAERVVGNPPESGPLVRAVAACANCPNVRMIYIRDWHDEDDPIQKAEMEFFGRHCIIGTHGARFIDVIENYSRDRKKSAVLDSITINDFEGTPMVDVIGALSTEHPISTMPVGVIGVWTNVKVHYLLYDLKTRMGCQNLATCSKLIASPDSVAHRTTLHHLEEVLGVKVFHKTEEFLEFLGVKHITTAPASQS